ncbi:MAG: DUF3107 domain-containing protein [Acidimicrobiales bacterium]
MDLRIGVTHVPRELDVELGDEVGSDGIAKELEEALSKPDGVLWLTDRRGRRIGVPAAKIAYVELGSEKGEHQVGFGIR